MWKLVLSKLRALIDALKGEVGRPEALALLLLQDGAALGILLAGLSPQARAVVSLLLSEVQDTPDEAQIPRLGLAREVTYRIAHCSCRVSGDDCPAIH